MSPKMGDFCEFLANPTLYFQYRNHQNMKSIFLINLLISLIKNFVKIQFILPSLLDGGNVGISHDLSVILIYNSYQ